MLVLISIFLSFNVIFLNLVITNMQQLHYYITTLKVLKLHSLTSHIFKSQTSFSRISVSNIYFQKLTLNINLMFQNIMQWSSLNFKIFYLIRERVHQVLKRNSSIYKNIIKLNKTTKCPSLVDLAFHSEALALVVMIKICICQVVPKNKLIPPSITMYWELKRLPLNNKLKRPIERKL